MRKQERQVLENAIKTMNSVVDYVIETEKDLEYLKDYIKETVNDLYGYASIQQRFAGMKEKDYDEFTDTILEFKLIMFDKIYTKGE